MAGDSTSEKGYASSSADAASGHNVPRMGTPQRPSDVFDLLPEWLQDFEFSKRCLSDDYHNFGKCLGMSFGLLAKLEPLKCYFSGQGISSYYGSLLSPRVGPCMLGSGFEVHTKVTRNVNSMFQGFYSDATNRSATFLVRDEVSASGFNVSIRESGRSFLGAGSSPSRSRRSSCARPPTFFEKMGVDVTCISASGAYVFPSRKGLIGFRQNGCQIFLNGAYGVTDRLKLALTVPTSGFFEDDISGQGQESSSGFPAYLRRGVSGFGRAGVGVSYTAPRAGGLGLSTGSLSLGPLEVPPSGYGRAKRGLRVSVYHRRTILPAGPFGSGASGVKYLDLGLESELKLPSGGNKTLSSVLESEGSASVSYQYGDRRVVKAVAKSDSGMVLTWVIGLSNLAADACHLFSKFSGSSRPQRVLGPQKSLGSAPSSSALLDSSKPNPKTVSAGSESFGITGASLLSVSVGVDAMNSPFVGCRLFSEIAAS